MSSTAGSNCKLVKEREDETSQLNRLDLQFLLRAHRSQLTTYKTHRRNSHQLLLSAIQVLTTNKQLANSSSGSN